MKKTIDFYDFKNEFMGSQYENNFSKDALIALFDYYERLEEDTGEDIELDITAIACDWNEYEDIEEVKKDYNIESLEELQDNTTVLELDNGGLVVQCY